MEPLVLRTDKVGYTDQQCMEQRCINDVVRLRQDSELRFQCGDSQSASLFYQLEFCELA